jgi:hypothetical protein
MRGEVMSSRRLFASVPMACLLVLGFLGIAPVANAESGAPSVKPGKIAKSNAAGTKRRVRSVRIHLPIGPSYVYHDYPYYYCRGYYPRHIGGYVYYPYYYYYRSCYWGSKRDGESRRHHKARRN